MAHNIIDQCREINLPPPEGDQYYLVLTEDGGQSSFGATRCANAFDIITNCLCINGMDWADILHRARINGTAPPSIMVNNDPDGYGCCPYQRFTFECGTYKIIGEGPFDFDEAYAKSKKPTVPLHDLDSELKALEKIDTSSKPNTTADSTEQEAIR